MRYILLAILFFLPSLAFGQPCSPSNPTTCPAPVYSALGVGTGNPAYGLSQAYTNLNKDSAAPVQLKQTYGMNGGTAGFVIPTLRIEGDVSGNPGDFAWVISSILNNNGASTGQPIAVAATAFRNSLGAGGNAEQWALYAQNVDNVGGTSTQDGAQVGAEIDVIANGADDFGNGIRIPLQVGCTTLGSGPAANCGYGIVINTNGSSNINRGMEINGNYNKAAIDLSRATLAVGGSAIILPDNTPISWDNLSTYQSMVLTGTYLYENAGTRLFQIDPSGNATITGFVESMGGDFNFGSFGMDLKLVTSDFVFYNGITQLLKVDTTGNTTAAGFVQSNADSFNFSGTQSLRFVTGNTFAFYSGASQVWTLNTNGNVVMSGSLTFSAAPTGTASSYACFTSGGELISSVSAC